MYLKRMLTVSMGAVCAISLPNALATNGMASHGFGINQQAMGGAAVAGHENAMSLATNPASMSFGEDNYTVGIEIFAPERSATLVGDKHYGANSEEYFPIPEFAIQKKLNDKHSVGVAVFGNGGMNTAYNAPIFDHFGGINSGIDLAQLFISPSWAMKVSENTSVGASLNLAYQRVKVEGIGDFLAPGVSADPAHLTDQDYDSSTGAGISIGMQHQLSNDVKIGASYRSRTKMQKFDKYAGLFAEQGGFDVPEMITFGVNIQATPKTQIALDFAHINYDDIKSVGHNNTVATQTGQLGTSEGAGFGWKDQNIVKLGVKYQYSPKLALMAGYNHAKNPIKESQTAFNVLAPATPEDHVTLGAEWQLDAKSAISAQYMHAFKNKVKGDPLSPAAYVQDPTFTPRVADLEMSQDSIGVAYTRKF